MAWVVVTLRHAELDKLDSEVGIVQVVECASYDQAVRLEEQRVETLRAPMWTHHVRRTFTCEEVPA